MIRKSAIYIIATLFLTSYLSCNLSKNDELRIVDEKDFDGINDLELKGIIYSTQKLQNELQGYHGRGIIRVNILESNINEYDPRDKQSNYFCIIKNGKAEIYGWGWLG